VAADAEAAVEDLQATCQAEERHQLAEVCLRLTRAVADRRQEAVRVSPASPIGQLGSDRRQKEDQTAVRQRTSAAVATTAAVRLLQPLVVQVSRQASAEERPKAVCWDHSR